MSLFARHPVITFSLGVAAGFLIHKYRKEIIDAANNAAEKGRDFVLEQKENLADVIAETQESDDVVGGA
jgi:hypothetical protein